MKNPVVRKAMIDSTPLQRLGESARLVEGNATADLLGRDGIDRANGVPKRRSAFAVPEPGGIAATV